jgi:hypothetical protein
MPYVTVGEENSGSIELYYEDTCTPMRPPANPPRAGGHAARNGR